MGTTACVKSLAAATVVGVFLAAPLAVPANALTLNPLVPYPTVNTLSLNNGYIYDVTMDTGTDPDVSFLVTAAEDLVSVTLSTVLPYGGQIGTLPNLTAQWFATDLSTSLSGLFQITDSNGFWIIPPGTLTLVLNSGDLAVLVVKGDPALQPTNLDIEVQAVPIPPALALFGSGVVGLGLLARRRKRKAGATAFSPLG